MAFWVQARHLISVAWNFEGVSPNGSDLPGYNLGVNPLGDYKNKIPLYIDYPLVSRHERPRRKK
jgi:hypothetical protein